MIDLLDDSDDFGDLDASDPSFFDCRTLSRDEMLAQIKRCGGLDGRSINLFTALERAPKSDLFELYLRENLYQPGSHYIYATPDPSRYGYGYWRPVVTEIAVECPDYRALCTDLEHAVLGGSTTERAHL